MTAEALPFPWKPLPAPTPVTQRPPRRRPARGTRPARPRRELPLPPRTLPSSQPEDRTPAATAAVLAPAGHWPAPHTGGDSRGSQPVGQIGGPVLRAAALIGAGVALHGAETLQAQLSLNAGELAALVDAGVLVEVGLGAGLTRYAFADAVPAALLLGATR